jgi:molybdopterin molybdotransferase
MKSVDEAVDIVLGEAETLPAMRVVIQGSKGYILSDPVYSDIDFPAFDRAMMDGYAVKASISGEDVVLPVDGVIGAGEFRSEPVPEGHSVKIMTGAPLPPGTDAVIQVELTSETEDGKVKLYAGVDPGANIAKQGEEAEKGSVLLPAGTVADSAAVSVMAMAGKTMVRVYSIPQVGILPTGSELVRPSRQIPEPGQVRDSNTYGLSIQCLSWGGIPIRLGHPADDPNKLKKYIEKGLSYNILVISGGVSMGDFDLIPDVLTELGVEIIFHKVAQKPGKPLLFGKHETTYVFGMPGNPVAAYLGFELYAGPMIRRMAGEVEYKTRWYKGIAAGDFKVSSDRTQFKASKVYWDEGVWKAEPVPSRGSADILAVVGTNSFVRFDKGKYTVPAGNEVDFFFTRGHLHGTQR